MSRVAYLGEFLPFSPYCIEEVDAEEVGEGTQYPISLTLDELMELFWRIRKLKISITATDHLGDPYAFTTTIERGAGSELELIKPTIYSDQQYDPYNGLFIFVGNSVKYNALNYHPDFYFQHDLSNVARISTLDSGASFNATIKLSNGVEKLIPMKASNLTNPQLSIEAIEYWPYAQTDNLPVYDTVTGATLPGRDPFN